MRTAEAERVWMSQQLPVSKRLSSLVSRCLLCRAVPKVVELSIDMFLRLYAEITKMQGILPDFTTLPPEVVVSLGNYIIKVINNQNLPGGSMHAKCGEQR